MEGRGSAGSRRRRRRRGGRGGPREDDAGKVRGTRGGVRVPRGGVGRRRRRRFLRVAHPRGVEVRAAVPQGATVRVATARGSAQPARPSAGGDVLEGSSRAVAVLRRREGGRRGRGCTSALVLAGVPVDPPSPSVPAPGSPSRRRARGTGSGCLLDGRAGVTSASRARATRPRSHAVANIASIASVATPTTRRRVRPTHRIDAATRRRLSAPSRARSPRGVQEEERFVGHGVSYPERQMAHIRNSVIQVEGMGRRTPNGGC